MQWPPSRDPRPGTVHKSVHMCGGGVGAGWLVHLSMNFVCSVCERVFVLFVCLGGKRKGETETGGKGGGEREEAPQHVACRLWGGIPFLHKF
jgi:hypothetical protein